ncbi:hypothetical protein DFJ58DRAFT_727222 [Suillus subalutaceus]|uniref:uncharacterized protein n=1 Tax=Suillus subalutaceus TaxID=48586 RepID=UPI001B868ECD|nr:uncharacterized protein DFJ58DRAFT_727222 [Suillus subalutaceus]KAG1856386.1 hypothetical protein DFJ58DRAFT_727222 [Suillus subalutaceus]
MDDLTCLGCSKAFPTQKSLSNHEARCDASKSLDADVYKQQRCLEKQMRRKNKRKRAHDESASPQGHRDTSRNARRSSLSPTDQMDVDVVDNNQWLDHDAHEDENIAGPSNTIIPEPELPIPPVPDAPAITSARSGRRIHLPARYADFLPAGPTNLPHIPPTPNSPPNRCRDSRSCRHIWAHFTNSDIWPSWHNSHHHPL